MAANPELQHRKASAAAQKRIQDILDAYEREITRLAGFADYKPGEPFRFENFPALRAKYEALIKALDNTMVKDIDAGVREEWARADSKNDLLAIKAAGGAQQASLLGYIQRNEDALEAFIQRKTNGMTLSDKVWKYTGEYSTQIQDAIGLSLEDHDTAEQLSRSVRKYLQHPDKLFRRVRDEYGILHLSKNAAAYHPGQGVYRSSYMNAKRLAATEINMAYRTSDYMRIQQLDFVVGIEVHLSNNHTCKGADGKPHPFTDICDELQGKYPKGFKFTGWHPFCRCYATTILKSREEMREGVKNSANEVKDVPQGFKDWVEENSDKIARARQLPYFLRDNGTMKDGVWTLNKDISETTTSARLKSTTRQTVPLKPEDIVKTGNQSTQSKQSKDIMLLKNYKELEAYMTANGLVANLALNTIPLESAKEICAEWAQFKSDWKLSKIDKIGTARMGSGKIAHANGGKMEINPSIFSKKNYNTEVPKLYKSCAGDWVSDRQGELKAVKGWVTFFEDKLKQAAAAGNAADIRYYDSRVKHYKKKAADIESELNAGYTRHNVMLTEQSTLRNTVQHEFGHVVDDQLLGSINGSSFKTGRIPTPKETEMKNRWNDLYNKYKGKCGWLSTYGNTTKFEFLAECMVLYSEKGGVGLPLEVKQWFDELKSL